MLSIIALPGLSVLAVYSMAALLPALFLMRYIYRADKAEPEPGYLLRSLALQGVWAAFLAMVLEMAGQWLLNLLVPAKSALYLPVLAFGVIGFSEEWAKFFFLKRRSWNDPNFNYRFDGIVYAVFVSLGFAAFENLKYVFHYGLSVVVPRALLAIPGHMAFGVFMGVFYGRARQCARQGRTARAKANLAAGVACAVVLHGFYDACAMAGTSAATLMFFGFVAVMYGIVIHKIKKEAAADTPVDSVWQR